VFDLQVIETSFNASIYLKLKALSDNYHNEIGCGQKQKQKDFNDNPNDVLNVISVKFNEIRVHGLSSRYPLLLAYMPSFSLNSYDCLPFRSPSDCSADSSETDENTWRDSDSDPIEEHKRSFDYNCKQLKLFLNSDSENKVILTGISSYYSCASHAAEEKESANHVFRCEKVEVEIFEEFVDFALKKETSTLIKHLCCIANTAIGKSSQGCVCSFLVQEFVLHLFHGAINKPLPTTRRRRCSKLSGAKRNRDRGDSNLINGDEPYKVDSTAAAEEVAAARCTFHHTNDFRTDFPESNGVSTIKYFSPPLQCVSNISFSDLNVFSNEKSTKFTAKKIVQNFGKFYTSNRYM
jgi:hypothetical protein